MAISQLLTGDGQQSNKVCEHAAQRETAAGIAAREGAKHEARARAYRFIEQAIDKLQPDDATEVALWDLLCRVLSERY